MIWRLAEVESYPEDEAALSPEELRQKKFLDEYLEKAMAEGGATVTPEVSAAFEARTKRLPSKIPLPDVARARDFLNRFDEVWSLLSEASRRPAYRRDRNWSVFESARRTPEDDPRMLMDLVLLECSIEAEEGRWDEAYGRVAQALRLGRLLDQEPMFICVRVAARRVTTGDFLTKLLVRHGPSQARADEMVALLQTDVNRRLRSFVIGECITSHDISTTLLTGRTSKAGSGFVRFYYLTDQAVLLESMGRIVKATDLPWRESLAEIATVSDGGLNSRKLAGVPLMMCSESLPGMKRLAEQFYWDDLVDRLFAVAVQVAAYHEAHGRYPETLSALPHADQLPRDPYTITNVGDTGKPLGYRVTADKFLVWSVGPDGKDDGGKTAKELGIAPDVGGDIVLEVSLVPQQQPARPEDKP